MVIRVLVRLVPLGNLTHYPTDLHFIIDMHFNDELEGRVDAADP